MLWVVAGLLVIVVLLLYDLKAYLQLLQILHEDLIQINRQLIEIADTLVQSTPDNSIVLGDLAKTLEKIESATTETANNTEHLLPSINSD